MWRGGGGGTKEIAHVCGLSYVLFHLCFASTSEWLAGATWTLVTVLGVGEHGANPWCKQTAVSLGCTPQLCSQKMSLPQL